MTTSKHYSRKLLYQVFLIKANNSAKRLLTILMQRISVVLCVFSVDLCVSSCLLLSYTEEIQRRHRVTQSHTLHKLPIINEVLGF